MNRDILSSSDDVLYHKLMRIKLFPSIIFPSKAIKEVQIFAFFFSTDSLFKSVGFCVFSLTNVCTTDYDFLSESEVSFFHVPIILRLLKNIPISNCQHTLHFLTKGERTYKCNTRINNLSFTTCGL